MFTQVFDPSAPYCVLHSREVAFGGRRTGFTEVAERKPRTEVAAVRQVVALEPRRNITRTV